MQRLCRLAYMQLWLLLLCSGSVSAQTPTPTGPVDAPTIPWWQITQSDVPYFLLFLVGLLTFILTRLFSPALDALGNALKYWVQGWGKRGDFRQRYLSHVIHKSHYLSMLTPNVVAARREYHQTVTALEDLFTPLEIGPAQDGGMGEGGEELVFQRATRTGRHSRTPRHRGAPRNRIQALWWRLTDRLRSLWHRIRPPWEPSAAAIGELIHATPRLVVRGHPGSGKTTVLRYLALICARSLRGNAGEGDNPKAALRRFGWKRAPFPVFVPLNLLADVGQWPEERRLVDKIIATLPAELRSSYPPGFLEKELRRGNCLILFDGFDELGSPSARGKMAHLIGDMANTYNHPQNRFLVSTRIVGYEGQLNGHGFQVHNVQELDDDAVQELVNRRYRAAALSAGYGRSEEEKKILLEDHNQKASDLLNKLRRNAGLRALTENPLLLSLITLVHMAQIGLPEQRHLLYRDCVEILTERWQERKREEAGIASARRPDELSLEQKIALLQEIALTMQQHRDGSASQVVIPRDEVRAHIAARLPDFVAAYLPEEGQARGQECQRRADALLENIREESGILIEKGLDDAGEPVIGFSHLTF